MGRRPGRRGIKKPVAFLMRVAVAVFVLGAAISVFAMFTWRQMQIPFQGFRDRAVYVEVERGMNTAQIAERLAQAGAIERPWHFRMLRYLRPGAVLQAGEYRFAGAASVVVVFDRLRRGDVFYVTISIPEGANLFEIDALLRESELIDTRDFMARAKDPTLIRDLAPEAPSLEGYLFPSTYQFRRRATAQELCERLTNEFRNQWKALGGGPDAHRLVTIASLVEKETSVPEERAQVASVYWNRIHEGMRLDCDPTVIYAALLEGRYRGTIYQSDLQREHPYNTYRRAGLPPGPIANPGAAALQAAIHPAQTTFLFFVARGDGSGGHRFSQNLAAHQRAVASYREAVESERKAERNNGGARR